MGTLHLARNVIAFPILLCCATTSFAASKSTDKIAKLLIDEQHHVVFVRLKAKPKGSNCVSTTDWHYLLEASNPAFETIENALIAANNKESTVSIIGSNACDNIFNIEKMDRLAP